MAIELIDEQLTDHGRKMLRILVAANDDPSNEEFWDFRVPENGGAMDYFPIGYSGPYYQVEGFKNDKGVLSRPVIACQSGDTVEGHYVHAKVRLVKI